VARCTFPEVKTLGLIMADSTYLASIYRLTGVNFWESAKKLDSVMEKTGDNTPIKVTAIPFYFLVSHAAELFLKSALLKRGWNEQQLKKYDYRHNLDSLLCELQSIGIIVTPETANLINRLSPQHADHSLRYKAQKIYLPPTNLIHSALEELLLLTRISTQGK